MINEENLNLQNGDSDVEKEDNNNVTIEIPFNPEDINVKVIPRNIGQLVELLEDKQILIPKYQRLPNLWTTKEKSRFIESLMLELPIPLFYFDESDDKKWYVIDGLQRMSTLEHFILGHGDIGQNRSALRLENLEFLTQFNNSSWADLPKDIKRRINGNQVTINLIGKGTPDEVKFTIFSRINQSSLVLKSQEIRTALFQGYRVDFLEKLVSINTEFGKLFHKVTAGSVKSKRQEDLDFASRFIAFYLQKYEDYQPDMDSFTTKGTRLIPDKIEEQNLILESYKKGLNICFDLFGTDSFRKRINLKDTKNPINKPMFEVLLTTFSKLDSNKILYLKTKSGIFKKEFIAFQVNNKKFWNSITTGTATKDSVNNRHTEFKQFLNNFLND
jgi:hypothetical protein